MQSMTDREKVINGLEYHLKELSVGKTCSECPYCGDNPCEIHLVCDTLELLQAKVKPSVDVDTYICAKCGHRLEHDLLEIKESLIKHIHLEKSRTDLNHDECFACAYRPDGEDTCETLRPLCEDALEMIKKLEPRVLGLGEIKESEGYWLEGSGDFIARPVICVHVENDAQKPYITFAWQFGTFSWETESYGIEWRCWSARP